MLFFKLCPVSYNTPYEKIGDEVRSLADEVPFDIPDSWEWVRLGELFQHNTGKALNAANCTGQLKQYITTSNLYWCRLGTIAAVLGGKRIPAGRKLTECNTGHVYIRVSDMTDGGVSTDRLLYVPEDIYPSISKYIINKADVFITVAGTIGRVGKIPDELDGANLTENADRLVLAVVNQDWLIKVLQSGMIQEQIAEATTQVGQPKLAIVRIERFLIPLPPLHEQERIVSAINTTLSIVQKL